MNLKVSAPQQIQALFKAQGVRELSVSLEEAAKHTENNNMDEVFFSFEGKDYVAFGNQLKFDPMNTLEAVSLSRQGVDILYTQDESNTMGEGVRSALNSTPGKIAKYGATGLGALAGAGLALFAGGMASRPQFVGMGALLTTTAIGGGIGAAVGYGATATVGALKGAVTFADTSSIDAITKK